MSKINFHEIDTSSSKVRKAPAPLEGYFVAGTGLVDSIAVSDIGYVLKPIVSLRLDQKRKINEAIEHIQSGNSRLALPLFSDVTPEVPLAEIAEEGEEAVPALNEALATQKPELVSLGFEVHMALTLQVGEEVGEPELFHVATFEADITDDMYGELEDGEEPTYMYNVVEMFDEHVKKYTDLIVTALQQSEQYANRAASILSQSTSAAARMGEMPASPEYAQVKQNIQTLDRNAVVRINKLIATPDHFTDQAIGYADPDENNEAALEPVEFNEFYAYLASALTHPDDLAFKILEAEAAVRQQYSFAENENLEETVNESEDENEDA